MVNPQGWNGYSYVLANPLRYVDRNGLFAFLPDFDDGTVTEDPPVTLDHVLYWFYVQSQQPGSTGGGASGGGSPGGEGTVGSVGFSGVSRSFLLRRLSLAGGFALDALARYKGCRNLFGNQRSGEAPGFDPVEVLSALLDSARNNGEKGEYGRLNFGWERDDAWAITFPGDASSVADALRRGVGRVASNVFRGRFRGTARADTVSIFINQKHFLLSSNRQNAAGLLHELGHAFNFLRGSGGFELDNHGGDHSAFESRIWEECFPGADPTQ